MDAPSQRLNARLFADYFQFYLWDKAASPEAPTDWTDEDIANRLKVAPNVVVVSPMRNMHVPVIVEIHASEPELRPDPWDHIAECSLELPSGQLELHECTGGSAGTLNVPPGTYRVRACFGGLGSLSDDGLSGEDHYLVALWRSASGPVCIRKGWQGGNVV